MRPLLLSIALAAFSVTGAAQSPPDHSLTAVDNWIRARVEADSFSGAVLVARNGVPLLRRGYGLANREKKEPVTPETKFNLGSIDKLITRIAIWQLVAAGKLELDVPVGKYLPDYPNEAVRERVTARHLFEMKSGVGNFMNDEYLARHDKVRTVDQYLELFAKEPLQFEPGTSMLYSNGGYIILGKLIERLSGKSYYDYVKAEIMDPVGMKDTRHYLIDERVPNIATGYTATRGPLQPNTYSLAGRGSPAGGGYSTVDDFLKLDAALRSARLLPAAFDSILGPTFQRNEVVSYGGGGPGTNTQYAAWKDGTTIIVFSNRDPSAGTLVAQELAKALGKTIPGGNRVIRRPGPGG
jgi:CubicO group peptidase (beta-lactamase class C family)